MKNVRVRKIVTRINRGIALGVALAVLLAAFIIIDNIRFQKDSEKMREDVLNYVAEMIELNKLVKSDVGCVISETDRENIRAGLSDILNKYHADPALAEKITVYDSYTSDEISACLEEWFVKTAGFRILSSDMFPENEDIYIGFQREGYRYARVQINDIPVQFTILASRVEAKNGVDPFIGGCDNYHIDIKYPDIESAGKRETAVRKLISGTMYMTLVDGEWKILMSEFSIKADPDTDKWEEK